jgi:hypothetical protein
VGPFDHTNNYFHHSLRELRSRSTHPPTRSTSAATAT